MTAFLPKITRQCAGFSLVEVALALGLAVVVISCIAGLWSNGQDRLKGAIDMTIAAQLAQRISADAELADFSEVLRIAGLTGSGGSAAGSMPRRYFSYVGREVPQDDPARIYEVLTRASRREQMPSGGVRWNTQGQLSLTIEVVASPAGTWIPVGADGLVDRAQFRWPVATFPFMVGGHSSW